MTRNFLLLVFILILVNSKTYNGLAQILIRTTKQPGEITLSATAEGLTPATLKIASIVVVPKPTPEDSNK